MGLGVWSILHRTLVRVGWGSGGFHQESIDDSFRSFSSTTSYHNVLSLLNNSLSFPFPSLRWRLLTFLSAFSVASKILMQKVWRIAVGRDCCGCNIVVDATLWSESGQVFDVRDKIQARGNPRCPRSRIRAVTRWHTNLVGVVMDFENALTQQDFFQDKRHMPSSIRMPPFPIHTLGSLVQVGRPPVTRRIIPGGGLPCEIHPSTDLDRRAEPAELVVLFWTAFGQPKRRDWLVSRSESIFPQYFSWRLHRAEMSRATTSTKLDMSPFCASPVPASPRQSLFF